MGIFSKTVRATLNGGAAPQSDGPGDPIVDWTTSGTARWMIDASGCLTIAPLEGEESGELEDWRELDKAPWHGKSSSIISAKIEGAIAISTATGMFFGCSSLESLDLSGLDASSVEDMFGMFDDCSGLRTVTFGEKFSFVNPPYPYPYSYDRCYLPTPQGEKLTGKWLSSADGKAYEPEAIPDNVAATYTAQVKVDISGAVISDIPD